MWARRILSVVSLLCLAMVSTQASSLTRFGAKLDINTQPSNAGNGIFCSVSAAHPDCSWVLMQAYQCEFAPCVNGHLAPKDGTVTKIRLIACAPGSIVLQTARAIPSTKQAKVIHSGPLINYNGDPQHCNGNTYKIDTFTVNVAVHKGDYLSVVTQKLGFVRCSGGGSNILLFARPLADGAALRTTSFHDGCFMLLEAIYNT